MCVRTSLSIRQQTVKQSSKIGRVTNKEITEGGVQKYDDLKKKRLSSEAVTINTIDEDNAYIAF